MTIDLRLDELVLHGVAARDGQAVGEALRAELGRLIAERGLPASLTGDAGTLRLDGARFTVTEGTPPSQMGAGIARALMEGTRP
ncbi:hypothetical protein [Longimicrobium terrae]|uniref:Uncharacterized protein n=1 Tax=Longimicrobium terrae TaxID=1639882 RepID=A0A841GW83_9BACT|nr:hypothetical protein [Longimicrobium terrae]MBB4634920.1 hypothetical protein [Longimicrobium terrae]MBB6069315.1 hypothetical protein [Longimicrobium terrae]NNC31877.1 hypothetical protein [Longimicrobium terrae]